MNWITYHHGKKKQERLFLIQAQILQRLGISRQPNITSPHISDDERSRMTQLFERMRHMRSHNHINDIDRPFRLYAERMQSFYPSCTLPNNTDRNTWDNQNSFRIFYDVTVPRALTNNEVSIMSAKLRLYKVNNLEVNPECASWEQNVSALPRYNMLDTLMHSSTTCGLSVSIFQYTKPVRANRREKKRFIDSHTVPADYRGWVEFNVIASLSQWLENPQKNYGFDVEVEDAFGNRLIPSQYFRNVNCSDEYVIRDPPFPNIMDIHPEMAENESSLFDNETYPTLDLQTAELTREEPVIQAVENNGRVLRKRSSNYNVRRSRCHSVKSYLTFRELGVHEIIIKPEGFYFTRCFGSCSSNYRGRTHNRPMNSCQPMSFKPLSVSILNSEGEARNTTIDSFLPSECGCRT